MAKPRPLRIDAFAVRGTTVVVTDEVIPVAVEAEASSGEVVRVHAWPLSAHHRGRPTVADVALTDDEILVTSPAAGGLVRIDRVSRAVTIVPLDADPGPIAVGPEALWVSADPEDRPVPTTELERRPVIWEEPSEEEIARCRDRMKGWFSYSPGEPPREMGATVEEARAAAEYWRQAADDSADVIYPPRPLWRITGDDVASVDVGGELVELAVANDAVVMVCQLPSDPLIKAVEPFGSLHYIRPGTVLVGNGDGPWRSIGTVEDTTCGFGWIAIDHERLWLIGFNRDAAEGRSTIREIDLNEGRLHHPLPLQLEQPVSVVAGQVVDLVWSRNDALDDEDEDDEEPLAPGRIVRLVPTEGGETRLLDGHLVDKGAVIDGAVTDGPTVWFRSARHEATLVAVDAGAATAKEVIIELDCDLHAPAAQAPEGVDLAAYEIGELDRLRTSLFGGWHGPGGESHPFIEGVSFEAVELRNEFPKTEIVATFRAEGRPGVRFGRRWPLYDDLGNQRSVEYADIPI